VKFAVDGPAPTPDEMAAIAVVLTAALEPASAEFSPQPVPASRWRRYAREEAIES
jgi:hypothetical protein